MDPEPKQVVDFTNTEIAFSSKTDKELKKMAWLFKLMNNPTLVTIGSKLGLWAVKLRLPFSETVIKNTIFEQFCGGINLMDSQDTIDKLYQSNVLTILDFAAEGKSSEEELNAVAQEIMRAIELAASNDSVPVVSCKVTGLADNALLEKAQSDTPLTEGEKRDFEKLKERLHMICAKGEELGVAVFIDAEESWTQITIDNLVYELMEEYNKQKCIVYNTYQLYRHDKLEQIKKDHREAVAKGYILGAKLVRGAYMEKERERARDMGYPDLIQPDKEATDRDYNAAVKYCVDNYEEIAVCNSTHNEYSNLYQAQLIADKGLDRKHPHLNFSQLLGMSDHITFNLAEAGFNVAKYVPYGPIRVVIPYLIRRAEENSSVTGEMTRELNYVTKEVKRRGL